MEMLKQPDSIFNTSDITKAANIIIHGGVVAFPTDTVYGLACDLFNPAAVERVYNIKGRPAEMPLIAMVAEKEQWQLVAISAPDYAQVWMARWWPGALTIVLPARHEIPLTMLGNETTIGIRIPDHLSALALLQSVGRPLATTSANLSGKPAAINAADVARQLSSKVDFIIDGGVCPGGMPSTVVDCSIEPYRILRSGPISPVNLKTGK
jgi:L-threonylcarbamoyladenylate synthase